jgi:hypothetical protein
VVRGGLGLAAHDEQGVTGVEEGVAVVFGAWGVRGKGKRGKWEGHELKKLMGKLRRSEGREETPAFATTVARCRSAGTRAEGEMAWQARGGPEERGLERRSCWGRRVEVKCSRRWRGAAGNGGQRCCSRGAEQGGARGRRKGKGSQGSM